MYVYIPIQNAGYVKKTKTQRKNWSKCGASSVRKKSRRNNHAESGIELENMNKHGRVEAGETRVTLQDISRVVASLLQDQSFAFYPGM
jgi:hypothetical protein